MKVKEASTVGLISIVHIPFWVGGGEGGGGGVCVWAHFLKSTQ